MNGNLAYEMEYQEELIGGKVVMMSPASANHTFISGHIYKLFAIYLEGKKCTPIMDGLKVYLTERDHFVPDMMVVCDRSKIKGDGVYGAPDLVVEVLSPSTAKNDRTHKMEVYAQCGVREYWIVSPESRSIEVYQSEDGKLILQEIYYLYRDWMLRSMNEAERAAVVTHFKCGLFDDLEISLEEIFSGLIPD